MKRRKTGLWSMLLDALGRRIDSLDITEGIQEDAEQKKRERMFDSYAKKPCNDCYVKREQLKRRMERFKGNDT